MKTLRYFLLFLSLFVCGQANLRAAEEKGVDVKEIVLGHMADAYEWHITTFNHKHISIPLPVIVRSEATGKWHVFSSSYSRGSP